MNKIVSYIVLFFGLLLLQIFFLNELKVNKFLYPQIYILFILFLPNQLHYFWHLLLGFCMGLTIDLFSFTIGIHAFSSVVVAFLKPYTFNYIIRSDYYSEDMNLPSFLRISSFMRYCFILVPLFHLILFMFWDLGFNNPLDWLIKTGISSLSAIFMMFLVYLTVNKKDQN